MDTVPTPPGFMICPDCDGMGEISTTSTIPPYNDVVYHCHRCEQSNGFVPIDHTSGVMRCQWRHVGGHIHCRVFGPYSGKAGDLVVRAEEWERFKTNCVGWYFLEQDDIVAQPAAWQ